MEKLPSSRQEAREHGLDRFFTGVACKHGHLAPRYVSTTNCVVCQVEHARRNGGWKARPSRAAYLDQARKFVEQRGGVLLSTEYASAKAKLQLRCADNHEFSLTPDNLKRGRWCSECKRLNQSKRLARNFWSVERLREFARQRHGGNCLATAPVSILSKVPWTCAKDEHPSFTAVIAKVLRGQWCPLCWQERRKPPKPAIPFNKLLELVRKRGGEIIRVKEWKGSKTRVVVRCENGHEWPADASNLLYAGSWCPECFNKGERIVRAIFERTLGGKFPKVKPGWLISHKGRRLELDGYNQEQQIAFEYQGPHHLSVKYVMAHDAIKREGCAARSIRLIEVEAIKRPFPPENVLEKVAEAFDKYGITYKPRLPQNEIFGAELKQLRELARRKGGQLLSNRYLGGSERQSGNAQSPNI